MIQYIDKDTLVAEIERRKEEEVNYDEDSKSFASYADHIHYSVLDSIQDFLDTLEIKDVDLEKSISDWLFEEGLPNEDELIDYIKETAKHFFELGLKAQKGE